MRYVSSLMLQAETLHCSLPFRRHTSRLQRAGCPAVIYGRLQGVEEQRVPRPGAGTAAWGALSTTHRETTPAAPARAAGQGGKNTRVSEKHSGSENWEKSILTVDKQRTQAERQAQKIPADTNTGEACVWGCYLLG